MRIAAAVAVLAIASTVPHAVAAEVSRGDAVKHYRAGQTALQTQLFADAEAEFRQAIQLDPLLVGAHYGLGQAKMATKAYPDAVSAFVAARDAFAAGQVLDAANRQDVQKRLDDQIKALQDDNRVAQRTSLGFNTEERSRMTSAITRNEEQIRTLQAMRQRGDGGPMPTPHWLSFALGSAYFRANDLANAEKEYRAALAQKPDLGEGHLNLGVVCMLTGRLDEAEREVALAEKAGLQVPPALKADIQKRRETKP